MYDELEVDSGTIVEPRIAVDEAIGRLLIVVGTSYPEMNPPAVELGRILSAEMLRAVVTVLAVSPDAVATPLLRHEPAGLRLLSCGWNWRCC